MIDAIGSGIGMGGHVIEKVSEFAAVPAEIKDILVDVSSQAFIEGMDQAIWVSSLALIGSAVISYFLIDDAVVTTPAPDSVAVGEGEKLAPVAGD